MQALAVAVIARDLTGFVPLLRAPSGVGGAYDFWRRTARLARGRRFHSEHATVGFQSPAVTTLAFVCLGCAALPLVLVLLNLPLFRRPAIGTPAWFRRNLRAGAGEG